MWALKVGGYDCKIEYLEGKKNTRADFLSRLPAVEEGGVEEGNPPRQPPRVTAKPSPRLGWGATLTDTHAQNGNPAHECRQEVSITPQPSHSRRMGGQKTRPFQPPRPTRDNRTMATQTESETVSDDRPMVTQAELGNETGDDSWTKHTPRSKQRRGTSGGRALGVINSQRVNPRVERPPRTGASDNIYRKPATVDTAAGRETLNLVADSQNNDPISMIL